MKMTNKDSLHNFGPYSSAHSSSFLISFEGIEGAGKTTQIEYLTKYLTEKGYEVTKFREPGGTKIGEALRSCILQSQEKLNPLTEAHIFCAARSELISKNVLPILEKENQVVILDRFIDSSLAYQGMARGLGFDTILELHQHFPLNVLPHLTFYLEIDLKTSMDRQSQRGNTKDYFEKENHDFYSKLIQGFEMAVKAFPNRIVRIDACADEKSVASAINKNISELVDG